MPDTKAPPKKTYFQTFLNRPNETSQEIQTFEGIFKNSAGIWLNPTQTTNIAVPNSPLAQLVRASDC